MLAENGSVKRRLRRRLFMEVFPAALEGRMQAVSASLAVAIGECWPKTALGKDDFGGGYLWKFSQRRLNGGCGLFLWPSIVFRRTPFGSGLAKRDLFWRQFCPCAQKFSAALERRMQAVSASLAVAIGECWPKTALGKYDFGGGYVEVFLAALEWRIQTVSTSSICRQ